MLWFHRQAGSGLTAGHDLQNRFSVVQSADFLEEKSMKRKIKLVASGLRTKPFAAAAAAGQVSEPDWFDALNKMLTDEQIGRKVALTVLRGTERKEIIVIPRELL
jgi:hypothetical protein